VDLQLRVGLNSGQLIPVEIGSGTLGYTVVGEQFGIAQWMESAPRFDAKPYERAYGDFGIVDSGSERVVASLEAGGNPLVTEAPKCNAATRCEGH
jgi:hypothetical protein